jgi:manganese/iron transport system permease protein
VLLALTIVASLKAVGIILVVAMLVGPGATAFLLARSFDRMLAVAVAVAVGSSAVGTLLSFHIDGATGPTIVLVQAAVFACAFAASLVRRSVAMSDPAPAEPAGTLARSAALPEKLR